MTDERLQTAAALAEIVRTVEGVRGLNAPRPALVEAAASVVHAVIGSTGPSPVALVERTESVSVSLEISVDSSSTAPPTARAVAAAVRQHCAIAYPGVPTEIDVRVVYVD